MIVVHASFPVDPDRRDDALDLIEDLVAESQREDGIVDYRATTDVVDPNVVRFVERYEDQDAFEAHTQTDHFREFQAALPELLGGEPDVIRFDVDSATELEL
ncbi:putative quinol monooxygenase [Natrinema salaciae]|uniref:Quinol monooxygenase YgiN n=1 Tax=Natrinema salaciae TaxID=1186196 RepID=A0A1H9GR44_9EURY|nr:putative quinol monooxygenase [Natrinema salaciae]SEQ52458.1 Quinol monooxygenase YgiN [Natrinema salaciae]